MMKVVEHHPGQLDFLSSAILGTFLTRSGVVQSVHAFARSDIGKWFVSLPGDRDRGHDLFDPGSAGLPEERIATRKPWSSRRESSFLFNKT